MGGVKKPARIKNPQLLAEVRGRACLACDKPAPNDPAHIRSRGCGGHDVVSNVIALCRDCHGAQHTLGWFMFCQKYPRVHYELLRKGWVFCGRKLRCF